jgi:hypothetical protein
MVQNCKENPKSQNVSISLQNVSIPSQNVSIPSQNISISSQNVSICSDPTDSVIKCERCYKKFTLLSSLRRHEPICKETSDPLQCPLCKKYFAFPSTKSRHMARCEGARTLATDNVTNIQTTTNNIGVQQNAQTINNNTNNNYTINVALNNFGQESLDHISQSMLDKFVKEIRTGVAKLIDEIHFNPNVPQNHNVRIQNVKGRTLAVYKNNEWCVQDMSEVINHLINNGCRILYDHYESSETLQKEDTELHHGVMLKNIYSLNIKNPLTFFPTKRQIIASLENQRLKDRIND